MTCSDLPYCSSAAKTEVPDSREPLPFIYMAPLRGITDALFRMIYCRHFSCIDAAVAPFINPQRKAGLTDKILADVLPEEQTDLPLIPQLLHTDAHDFLSVANRLYDLGYHEINWNLGCPVPMVAKKHRGSGLLPFPDQIIEFLEYVLPRIKVKLSIKMRLGYFDYQESLNLLPRLEHFPLTELIIHARLGTQLYRGSTAPEQFIKCTETTSHRLVYNGDITSVPVFQELNRNFPTVDRWMIGRGLIANPFLPSEIKGIDTPERVKKEQLAAFHEDIFKALKQKLSGPGHLLGRMKQVWIYFIGAFPGQEKRLKLITKASTEQKYLEAVRLIITEL